jgi:acyl transferase domain-containing protein
MIDTGCSGSIIALNSACQSLRSGETDMALAGGVGLIFSPDQFAMINQTGSVSNKNFHEPSPTDPA